MSTTGADNYRNYLCALEEASPWVLVALLAFDSSRRLMAFALFQQLHREHTLDFDHMELVSSIVLSAYGSAFV